MILRTSVVLIALLVSSVAQAHYMTYQKWSGMPEIYRVAYIAGAFDTALTLWADEDQNPTTFKTRYSNCVVAAGMTDAQLATNVMNFAKGKPELHTGGVPEALMQYLFAACGASPTK
jgi:hypothetical protein